MGGWGVGRESGAERRGVVDASGDEMPSGRLPCVCGRRHDRRRLSPADKLCINQTNSELRQLGIDSIGLYLHNTRCMLVLWSPECEHSAAPTAHAAAVPPIGTSRCWPSLPPLPPPTTPPHAPPSTHHSGYLSCLPPPSRASPCGADFSRLWCCFEMGVFLDSASIADGQRWLNVGPDPPPDGTELVGVAELARKLRDKTEFEASEWASFQIKGLRADQCAAASAAPID